MQTTLDLSELNTQIGRLFMAGMPGTRLDAGTDALIKKYCVGGVILFARNIENPVQLATLCNDLQERAIRYHDIPLFIAVDQEGGRVARLKKPFTEFGGNRAIGESGKPTEEAGEFARITAKEMGLVGLNMDMAPVVDVSRGQVEQHLVGRMFGKDPQLTSKLGETIIKGLQKNGIMAVAKHFPGLGKAAMDPHLELPTIEVGIKELKAINLPPFKKAVSSDVCGIMTSHAIYPALDPEYPGTLSHKVVTELLREKLGFSGLIITDDLEMGAIKKNWGVAEGAYLSFKAGADILLMCEDQGTVWDSIDLLRKRIMDGEIPWQRFQASLKRIDHTKSIFLKNVKAASLGKIHLYFQI